MADIIELPRRGLHPEDRLMREWQAARETCEDIQSRGFIHSQRDQEMLQQAHRRRQAVMSQYLKQVS